MREYVARFHNATGIDCHVAFVDMSNDPFLIDQKRRAISEALLLVEDSILLDDGSFEIAEYREGNLDLLCKFAVGGNAVYTHTENLSVG